MGEDGREPPTPAKLHDDLSRVFRDITESENAESCAQSEDLMAMLDSIPLDMIVVTGPHEKAAYANRRCRSFSV